MTISDKYSNELRSTEYAPSKTYVLPNDVELLSPSEMDENLRERSGISEGEFILSRPGIRASACIVDHQTAELVREFRSPISILGAIIAHASKTGDEPPSVLEAAYPVLKCFVNKRLLVPANSKFADPISAAFRQGDEAYGAQVLDVIQVVEDSEVYRVMLEGRDTCLKHARVNTRIIRQLFEREREVLKELAGKDIAPHLLKDGVSESGPYLLMEWVPGFTSAQLSAQYRATGDSASLLNLSVQICRIYARLHSSGIFHGDIHPGNLIFTSDGVPHLLDFGWSEIRGKSQPPTRGGVVEYFEPEVAVARLSGRPKPPSSLYGEQYAVATVIYEILTGNRPLVSAPDRTETYRHIAESKPASFSYWGVQPWPEVEKVLQQALSKLPEKRFSSCDALADAIETASSEVVSVHQSESSLEKITDDFISRFGSSLIGTNPETHLKNLLPPPNASINFGASGTAYAFYRIAIARGAPELLSHADIWISLAEDADQAQSSSTREACYYNSRMGVTPDKVGLVSPWHSASGVHMVRALIAHARGDVAVGQRALNAFVESASRPSNVPEVALGYGGGLLGASILLDATPQSAHLDISSLLVLGEQLAQKLDEALNQFIRSEGEVVNGFLGAAHGLSGMLQARLSWHLVTHTIPGHSLKDLLRHLIHLGDKQNSQLHWPRKLQSKNSSRTLINSMSGWCNGSSGMIFPLLLAEKYWPDQGFLDTAISAGQDVWSDINCAPSLCCGLTGRGYALLALERATGDQIWGKRAYTIAERVIHNCQGSANNHSLFKGVAGTAVLAAELTNSDSLRTFPMFEIEGWNRYEL